MQVFASREAKNEFGRLLDNVQREPVTIEKKGRPVAVMLSIIDYQHYEEMEDAFWCMKAQAAAAEGFCGIEESEKFLDSLNHVED